MDWPIPKTPTEICKFLGFTGYYWYFVQGYSKIAHPLLDLTKKAVVWEWGKQQHRAFKELKTHMCSHPVLTQPDFEKPFFLQTDASAYGMGTILSQEGEHHTVTSQKPKLHLIIYYSTTFTPTEWNYNIYKWELLAIMKALTHWQHSIAWHDGMPTSKNTTSSSNTSLERSTPQWMNCHTHLTWTKVKMTTKTKPSSNPNSLSIPPI